MKDDIFIPFAIITIVIAFFIESCIRKEDAPTCYRYVDYQGNEYRVSEEDKSCTLISGEIYCGTDTKAVKVVEIEKTDCEE